MVSDYHVAVIFTIKTIAMAIVYLLHEDSGEPGRIIDQFRPVLSREEYIKKLDKYFS